MAGIGFRLRKIFANDTYTDTLRGVVIAAAIAGGPIFFSILCLILLGVFATFITSQEMDLFLVTLVYVFAFSLISTGIIQLLITRYLSDLIYVNKVELILPAFSAVLALTVICQLVIGLPFILRWQVDFLYKIAALILYIVIGC
ncbi:MAG: exopolysaccharide Pel transporter PelG, partial [bacterium]